MRHFLLPFLSILITLLVSVASAAEPKVTVLRVEAAMRVVADRYYAMYGSTTIWPESRDGIDPGPYPKDCFYGDNLSDRELGWELVDVLYSRVATLAYASLKTSISPSLTPNDLQTFNDDISAIPYPDETNYPAVFKQMVPLLNKIGRSEYIKTGNIEPIEKSVRQGSAPLSQWPGGYTFDQAMSTALDAYNSSPIYGDSSDVNGVAAQLDVFANYYGYGVVITEKRGKLRMELPRPGARVTIYKSISTGTGIPAGTHGEKGPFELVAETTGGQTWTSPEIVVQPTIWSTWMTATNIPQPTDPTIAYEHSQETRRVFLYAQIDHQVSRFFDGDPLGECEPCSACSSGSCSSGEHEAGNESLAVTLALGAGPDGSAGSLLLKADTPHPKLGRPEALQRMFSAGVMPILDPSAPQSDGLPSLRQVVLPTGLVDVVTLNAFSYELRFYTLTNRGAPNAAGVYQPTGSAFKTVKIENADQSTTTANHVIVTFSGGSGNEVADYVYDPLTAGWILTKQRQGQTTVEQRQSVTAANGDRVETHTIVDGQSTLLSKERNTYHRFPWNELPDARNTEELIESVVDPDGAAQTTTYTYYTNATADGVNYGKLKNRVDPNGHWVRYEYDSGGRLTRTISPFGNSVLNATNGIKIEETIYQPWGTPYLTQITTLVRLDGTSVETARSYVLREDGGPVRIVCQTAGAAWDASDNLVTATLFEFDDLAGRPSAEFRPDGTATLHTYQRTGNFLQTTTNEGSYNSSLGQVTNGTRTIRTANERNVVVSESLADIVSGLVLSSRVATQFDSVGRVTRYDYTDGTSEITSYDCCGLEYTIGRDGIRTDYQHGIAGQVERATRGGITTRYAYDLLGRQIGAYRIGSDNTEMPIRTVIYDVAGRITSETAAGLRTTTFAEAIDAAGQTVKTTTLPGGGTKVETFARDGSIVEVSGSAVAPMKFEYGVETPGSFVKEIRLGANGEQTEWTKTYTDLAGRVVQKLFPDGAMERNYYNVVGQLARVVDADGVTTLFSYNARGEQETVAIDLNANNTIDLAGMDRIRKTIISIVTKTESSVNYTVTRSTTQVWETDNQDTPVTVSIAEQSSDGLRTWQTVRGLTTRTVTILDGSGGRTVTTTAPDGVKTVQVYAGERLSSTIVKTAADVQLSAATFAYDAHGRLSSTTDARNGATTFTYFADDQIQSVTTPDPDTALSGPGYDPQITAYAYDSAGRVQSVTQPDSAIINTIYWPTGAVKRTWGSRTYPVEYSYDAQGRVKTLTTWQNFAGDSGKAVTTWNYDATRGFLLNKRYADSTGPIYTYKPSGRLLTRTWARTPVIITLYSYNAAGDLTGTDYSDTTPDVTLTYDRSGRPKTMTDGVSARALAYHASGQLEDETYTSGGLNGFVVDRNFDSLHRLSGLSVPSVSSVVYSYDNASRLDTVTLGQNTATYVYLANSPLVGSVTFKNAGATRLTTTKTYDKLNRLSSIASAPSASSAVNHSYTHNSANQRTRVTREDNAYWNYGYDSLGQVTSGKKHLANDTAITGHDFAWTYDDIGNRKTATTNGSTATYTPTALNQYAQRTVPGTIDVLGAADATATVTVAVNNGTPQATTRQGELFHKQVSVTNTSSGQNPQLKITGVKNLAGPAQEDVIFEITKSAFVAQTPETFAHDLDGNLTADARWNYTWDGENRLVTIEASTAAVTAGAARQKLEFAYDGQSRRISKKVYAWNVSTSSYQLSTETRFLYDGWNLLAELNALSSNTAVRTYVWGFDLSGSSQGAGGVGGLLAVNDVTSGSAHFVAYDGNGNVAGLAKANDGTAAGRYDYNAFGESTLTEGSFASSNPFRFSTKYVDSETGHLYYGFRYYTPETGRWPNRDPLEEEGGLNLYAMVGNDSINAFDALGLAKYRNVPVRVDYSLTKQTSIREIAGLGVDAVKFATGLAKVINPKNAYDIVKGVDRMVKKHDGVGDLFQFLRGTGKIGSWKTAKSDVFTYSANMNVDCAHAFSFLEFQAPNFNSSVALSNGGYGMSVSMSATMWLVWLTPEQSRGISAKFKEIGDYDEFQKWLQTPMVTHYDPLITSQGVVRTPVYQPAFWMKSIQDNAEGGSYRRDNKHWPEFSQSNPIESRINQLEKTGEMTK